MVGIVVDEGLVHLDDASTGTELGDAAIASSPHGHSAT